MSSSSFLSLIDFILVRPQYPGNTGSVARALMNCGFQKMVFIRPEFEPNELEARKYALGCRPLLQTAPVFSDFKKGIAPYKLLLGTSRRTGAYRKNFVSMEEAPALIESIQPDGKIGILFGNEMNGLSNDELEVCQHILYIPTSPLYASLNLSQAVLLIAHQLYRSKISEHEFEKKKTVYPSNEELEAMYEHLKKMLGEIGFVRKTNDEHIPKILRNIFGRAHLTETEMRVIRGICRQVLWYGDQKKEETNPEE